QALELLAGFIARHHASQCQTSNTAPQVLEEVALQGRHTVLGQDLFVLGPNFLHMLQLDIVEHRLRWHKLETRQLLNDLFNLGDYGFDVGGIRQRLQSVHDVFDSIESRFFTGSQSLGGIEQIVDYLQQILDRRDRTEICFEFIKRRLDHVENGS